MSQWIYSLNEQDMKIFITILGAVLAAFLTNVLMLFREMYNNSKMRKKEKQKLAKTLQAEITALISIYKKNKLLPSVPQKGDDIRIVRLNCNYISVFENNTNKLGILNEDDISDIITLYINIKGLMDTLMVLADRWDKYALYSRVQQLNVPSDVWRREVDYRLYDVQAVHPVAIKYQQKVLSSYKDIINSLDKYISK